MKSPYPLQADFYITPSPFLLEMKRDLEASSLLEEKLRKADLEAQKLKEEQKKMEEEKTKIAAAASKQAQQTEEEVGGCITSCV